MAASQEILEAEASDRLRQMEELKLASVDKDNQLKSMAESRASLENSARVQAEELDEMKQKVSEMQAQLEAAGEEAKNDQSQTSAVRRSAAAVELALETNDAETREKMEEMEAELTKMLCHLHMRQSMLGFHE